MRLSKQQAAWGEQPLSVRVKAIGSEQRVSKIHCDSLSVFFESFHFHFRIVATIASIIPKSDCDRRIDEKAKLALLFSNGHYIEIPLQIPHATFFLRFSSKIFFSFRAFIIFVLARFLHCLHKRYYFSVTIIFHVSFKKACKHSLMAER